jgi:DNA-binding response OmpR family regulator
MKILVCDDEVMMLKAVEFKLKRDGYDVIVATNGRDASDIIKNDNTISLVITDLLMPFFNGLELINLIKNELKRDLPIMVLSKIGLEDTVLKAFELGADDYMVKPFSVNELTIRAKKLLMSR